MLISIKINSDQIEKVKKDSDFCSFFESICRTIRYGKHYVVGSIKLFRTLSSIGELSSLQKDVFRSHADNMVFLGNYDNQHFKMEIVYEENDWVINELDEATQINSYNFFNGKNNIEYYIGDSVFVAENSKDTKTYRFFFENLNHIKKTNKHIHYRPAMGSGNDSYETCKTEKEITYNVFCICDSDKRHPNDTVKKTAQNVIKLYNKKKKFYHITDFHEIENIIPLNLFKIKQNKSQSLSVEYLEYLSSNHETMYYFYDIKKSHKYSEIFCGDNDMSRHWMDIYNNHEKSLTQIQKIKSIIETENTKDVVIHGKLESLAKIIKDDIEKQKISFFKEEEIQPHHLLEKWNDIAVKMESWFISTPEMKL